MKKILVSALASIVFSLSFIPALANPVPAPPGLVGWWKGDGNTLDTVAANNGVNQNAAFSNGVVGQAFSFDPENFSYGTYSGIQIADQPAYVLTNSLTIEGWIRPRGDGYNIFFRGDHRPGLDPYFFGMSGASNINLWITDESGNYATVGAPIAYSVWTYVAATWDGSSGAMKIYTNGVLAAQISTTVRPFGQLQPDQSPGIGIGNVNDGGNNFPFIGDVDEISLYNRALTASEIQGIYNAGGDGKSTSVATTCTPPAAGLVSWWSAENNTADVTGGNNGTWTGTGNLNAYGAGIVSQTFAFDGTHRDRVDVGNPANLQLQNFTIEAWVKRASAAVASLDENFGDGSIAGPGGFIFGFGAGGYGLVLLDGGEVALTKNSSDDTRVPPVITDTNWHHVAVTKVGTTVVFYVDGVQQPAPTPSPYTDIFQFTTSAAIASRGDGGGNTFYGLIDELSIYNRALATNEIQAIYHAGSSGKCTSATITSAPPAINNITPNSGSYGTTVTLTGTNFSATPAANIVYFGAVRATVLAASPTNLVVTVPVGAIYGPVTVTTGGLVAYSSQLFEPTFIGSGSNVTTSSFAPSFNLGTGGGPGSSLIADLDGDGKPDIALVTGDGHVVSIFRNISTSGALLGTNSFAPRIDLPFPTNGTGGNPYRLRAADLDGDGRLDLIACEVSGSRVSIFHNIATPGNLTPNSFEPAFALATGSDCRFATAADLDGDGRVDIVALNYGGNSISIFKNIGALGSLTTNSFAPAVVLAAPGGPYEATIADLNNDGKPDFAVANTDSGTVSVYQNTSVVGALTTNSFAPQFEMACGNGAATIMAADIDGDGKVDLIAGSVYSQTVNVFQSTYAGGLLTTNSFGPRVDFSTPGWMHTVSLADFNGDGKPDICVVGELGSYMAIFQNLSTPGATFTTASLASRVDFATGYNAWGVSAGDLDGDGRPDVVFCNDYDSNIQIYQNAMSFGTPPPACTPPTSGLVGWWRAEGDANDSIGGNNGSLLGGLGFASGEVGQGFYYSQTNQAVDVPASAAIDVGAGSGFTLEAWIKPQDVAQSHPIFEWNDLTYWGVHFNLEPGQPFNSNPGPGELYANIPDSYGNWHQMSSPGGVVATNVFQHIALTYDKASGLATIYCNGQIVAQQNFGSFTPRTANRDLYLGRRPAPSGEEASFAGLIDEPSIYNRALGSNEIAAIYQAGSAGKCYSLLAPLIIFQPTNLTVLVNGSATFSVTAQGSAPLYYQWNCNGTNIIGATNTVLTLGNIQTTQAGNYSVLVSNLVGVVVSSNAVLTVVPPTPPTILSQTHNQVVLVGSPATFTVTAGGTDPLSYFWQRDGSLIAGATNSSYTLLNAQLFDSGSKFSCLVTNLYGFTASTNATLKVLDTISNDLCSGAIVVTSFNYTNTQSTARASSFGDPLPDCIDGFGNGVWYQFTAPVNGLLIVDTFGSDFDTGLALYTGACDALTEVACNDDAGGVTSQETLPTVAGTTYSILVGGYNAHVGNLVLHLNYLTPPTFVLQPTNQSIVVSSNVNFATTVTGTQPISCQWYFNNSPLVDDGRITGSTNLTLNIASVLTNHGGTYQVVASNFLGLTTSSVAVLTPVILPPVFLVQPLSRTVHSGSNLVFFALVDGTPPYSYQWYFNGNPLADDGVHLIGSATTALSIFNVTTADAGSYSLQVTNLSGATNSDVAVLTVMVPPLITSNPVGRSVPPGLPTTFSAVATGIPTPSYQWQFNGTNIPAAIASNYTVTAVSSNNLGYYHVIVSNSVGVATGADAQLTFGPVAAWGRNLQNESLPPPNLSNVIGVAGTFGASFAVRADGTIAAWGSGTATNIPASASNVVAVAAYANTANYALRADGRVVSWPGASTPILNNIVAVATGNNSSYALRAEGTVTNIFSKLAPDFPAGLTHITAIASGYVNAIALKSDGTIVVAGGGVVTNVPAGLTNAIAVAVGSTYAMALKADGRVAAWGSGTITNLPAGLTNIVYISAGNYPGENFGMAIRDNGRVVVWGDNSFNETNQPNALTNLFSITGAAAAYHGLALVSDGRPLILQPPIGLTAFWGRDVTLQARAAGAAPLNYQWLLNGTNISGATNSILPLPNIQLGNAGSYQLFVSNTLGTIISLAAPVNVLSNNTLSILTQNVASPTNVYQGGKFMIGGATVQGNGPLRYQWFFGPTNKNYVSISGATNDTLTMEPALAVQSGYYYLSISNQFFGVTSAPVSVRVQFARAWGFQAISNPPVNVTNAIALATGGANGSTIGHYLALGADGKLSAWGVTAATFQSVISETNVSALSNTIVTAVSAGPQHSLALKSDGTVYAWGSGATNPPNNLNGVTAIACGEEHDLALKADGSFVGWAATTSPYFTGINYGQATNYFAATNVVAIAAGNQHSVALRSDGSVVAWGYNASGQTIVPINATNVIAIAAGNGFSAALRANGTVVQWGNGTVQYPFPANLSNVVAISAASTHCTALKNDGSVVTWGYEYIGLASNNLPSDLANVIAISSGGDHDFALFGNRAPAFTIQPWSRTVVLTKNVTTTTLAGKCAGVQPMSYQWRLNGTNYPGATNDTLTLRYDPGTSQFPSQITPGAYQLVASNAYGVAISKPAKVTLVIPLGEAVDATNLNWTTTGSAPWYGQTNITHDGLDAARSGGIGASQESILQTTLATNSVGAVTFWWKVSSEQFFDTLEFRVNGSVLASISGEVDWQQASVPIPVGTNLLQWRYSKDSSFDAGLDAGFVDQFAFSAGPVITRQLQSPITVNEGATVALSVIATGSPTMNYQWRQNGNLIGNNNAFLTLNHVGRAQNGTYFVTVTNAGGVAVSTTASVHVNVPQLLGTPKVLPDGTFQLTSTDADGGLLSPSDLANFEAQASTNLLAWVTLPGALSITNGSLLLQDASLTNYPARYYRIIEH